MFGAANVAMTKWPARAAWSAALILGVSWSSSVMMSALICVAVATAVAVSVDGLLGKGVTVAALEVCRNSGVGAIVAMCLGSFNTRRSVREARVVVLP